MNDKQRSALKELADVMEKHSIAMTGHDRGMFIVVGGDAFSFEEYSSDRVVCPEYIREVMNE